MKLFNKIKEIYFKPVKIKSELDGMKKQNRAKERAYRERLVIQLSPQMRVPCIPQASQVECSSKFNLIAKPNLQKSHGLRG